VLFKFLPRRYADAFVSQGEVLFRTLSYFRAIEHAARGDLAEGVHVDDPGRNVTLETNTGIRSVGRYRYLRSIKQDSIFAFCCSTAFDPALFDSFGSDACVVIQDSATFFLRCQVALKRPLPIEPPGLIHGPVSYFAPDREAPLDITNSRNIPFLKHEAFADQKEYRAIFARRGGFTMLQRIVQPQFTFAEEIAADPQHHRILRLGKLTDITDIRSR